MAQVYTRQVMSKSAEQTEQLGKQLGKNLRGGEVIELVSDLGGGKTTLVRGLVLGSGSQDKVASPTFTINKIYSAARFPIYHFDFYRLAEAGVVAHELHDALEDPTAVIVVEWGQIVQKALPPRRLIITFQQTADQQRQLTFRCPLALEYCLEGIC